MSAVQERFSFVTQLSANLNFSDLPSLANLYFAPVALKNQKRKFDAALKNGDREGLVNVALRVPQNMAALTEAGASAGFYGGALIAKLGGKVAAKMTQVAFVAGLIQSVIEGVFSVRNILREKFFLDSSIMEFAEFLHSNEKMAEQQPLQFMKTFETKTLQLSAKKRTSPEWKVMQSDLKKGLQSEFESLQKIHAKNLYVTSTALIAKTFVQKYFNPNKPRKTAGLSRRVGKWACTQTQLDMKMSACAKGILSYRSDKVSKDVKEVHRTFEFLDIQARKKLLIAGLGLGIAGLTIAGTVLSMGGLLVVPLIIFGVGLTLGIAKYLLSKGMMKQDGWRFSFRDCIPQWVLRVADRIEAVAQRIRPSAA